MKKTKVVCSIGPASSNIDMFMRMVENGMNVARINLSHAEEKDCEDVVNLVHEANRRGNFIGIMYDTKGPDFRTGILEDGEIELIEGMTIRLTKEDILGNQYQIPVNYKSAIDTIPLNSSILIDDGTIRLEPVEKDDNSLICKVIVGGVLANHKGINVPGVDLGVPFLSDVDIKDITYACNHDGDFIALSFVSCKEDVLGVREIINKNNSDMRIISKIESTTGIENIDEIIDVSDGIMVARGDLGVEVPMNELPILQKMMIKKCREKGKICIVATEMLSSMTSHMRPTRAEVSDVANAVLDGADAVMLSNETTIGKYPDLAVKMMSDIAMNTENYLEYSDALLDHHKHINTAITSSVVVASNSLNAKAILACTLSGNTARRISSLRPKAPILTTCTKDKVARSLSLNFGVVPSIVPNMTNTDEIVDNAIANAKSVMQLEAGDKVVITGGFPQSKGTNFLKIEEI